MSTILVVEDEPRIRENIVDLLELEGYDVLEAPDGQAGLSVALEHRPTLIICDVMMPKMTGHEMLQGLREEEGTTMTPFIFLTARAEKGDIRTGMNLGANDYLTKPFSSDELLEAVGARLKQQAAQQKQQEAVVDELRGRLSLVIPHELRTPLVSILGYGKMLLDDWEELDRDLIQEMLEDIYKAGERLERFAENYGLYAQLQLTASDPKGRRHFFPDQACAVQSIIEQHAFRVAATHKRVGDISFEVDEASIHVSGAYLAKIIDEVVDNAFKFSEAGTPVQVIGEASETQYHVRISDQGRGMTDEQVARIGAFMQFERSYHEQQGLGLGLLVAMQLVQIYDGRLDVQSTLHGGTTVHVTLPTTFRRRM